MRSVNSCVARVPAFLTATFISFLRNSFTLFLQVGFSTTVWIVILRLCLLVKLLPFLGVSRHSVSFLVELFPRARPRLFRDMISLFVL